MNRQDTSVFETEARAPDRWSRVLLYAVIGGLALVSVWIGGYESESIQATVEGAFRVVLIPNVALFIWSFQLAKTFEEFKDAVTRLAQLNAIFLVAVILLALASQWGDPLTAPLMP